MSLNTEEMREVGELLNESFLSVMSNTQQQHLERILAFSFTLVKQEMCQNLFSGNLEGTDRLISLMYDDPIIRDFILKVGFHFFAKFGNTDERYPELVDNLAEAIGFIEPTGNGDQAVVLTPVEFLGMMPEITNVRALLLVNRWAVTLVLMMLYLITPEDLSELYRLQKDQEKLDAQTLSGKK